MFKMSEDCPIFKKIVWNALKNCSKDTSFEENESIKSPIFEVPIGNKFTKWFLGLYPNGYGSPSHMSLFLYPLDDLQLKYVVSFTLYIIGKSGKCAEMLFHNKFEGKLGRGAHNFLTHAKFAELFDDLVSDGKMTIGCEIAISSKDHRPRDQFSVESSCFKVSDDIQKMFEDELLKDFELKCNDGVKLKCHKFILAARSPVFKAMLSNDMQETKEGFAEVQDFDSTVMKEVLRFIYCDQDENLDNISKKLIFAAEKYDLEVLKKICIENIIPKLTKENVIEILLITEKINDCEKLFKECVVVIARDFIEITQSQDWDKLSKEMLTKIIAELKEPHKVDFIG